MHHPEDFLGAIYNVHWSNIFSAFGCNLGDFSRDQAMFAPSKTQLDTRVSDTEGTIVVPMRPKGQFKFDRTSLLAKLGKIWGEVPIRLLQHMDLRNSAYGFVGLSDRTMFPIPAGFDCTDRSEPAKGRAGQMGG